MSVLLNYEVNRVVSNTVTAIACALAVAWQEGPMWHCVVLCIAIVFTNVTGHGEGLTREYRVRR